MAQTLIQSNTIEKTPEQTAQELGYASLDALKASLPSAQQPTTVAQPVAQTINRSITPDPTTAQALAYLDTFQQPETVEQIANRKRKESQGMIDEIKQLYGDEFAQVEQRRNERLAQQNAMSVLSGTSGSGTAYSGRDRINVAAELSGTSGSGTAYSGRDRINVAAELSARTAAIYGDISAKAAEEARQQRLDATAQAEGILKRSTEQQQQAVDTIKALAASGSVDFDAFASNPQNADVYNYALRTFNGSEDALRGFFALNRPVDQIVGAPQRVGDKFVQAYQNPLTGKVSYDVVALPNGMTLPKEYSSFQKLGDNLVVIPDGWDGDTSKLVTIVGQPSTEDKLRQQMLSLQIQGQSLDNQKKSAELAGGVDAYNGDFDATIKLVSNAAGTSNAQRAQVRQVMQQLITNKDYGSAYALVSQTTGNALKGTAGTRFQEQTNALGVISDLETAIRQYQSSGGNMNIFKGTADKIQTKIGALMTDPKYASVAVQLDSAFQNYRLQMTGAAFGVKESAEYASVLPSKGNTLDLNLAKISGAKNYLNSSVESSIKSVVGEGGVYIKQYAEGAGAQQGKADDPLGIF